MDWGERNAGGSMFCRGEGVGNESDNGKTCTTHPHRDTQTVILLDHRLSMPRCKSCCSFQSHTCTLTACHTYTHTHTYMDAHTPRRGFGLDLSCSVSLSVVVFIPVLCFQEDNNSFSTIFFILSDKQLPVRHTHARARPHTHTQTAVRMH